MHKRLLSIDFDYFAPELSFDPEKWALYDWGHRDGGNVFLNELWYHRAAGFLMNNLPLPTTSGAEKNFWSRFKFTPSTKLYYADSHVNIYNESVYKGIREVYSYDAHHDGGYGGAQSDEDRSKAEMAYVENGRVTCEDWAVAFEMLHNIDVRVFYPKWKPWAMEAEPHPLAPLERSVDHEEPVSDKFHRIFVCRSGGWTPSWMDDDFEAFIEACPVSEKINMDGVANRAFDHVRLMEETQMQTQIRAEWAKVHGA